MNQIIQIIISIIIFCVSCYGQTVDKKFFDDVDAFMKNFVTDGRVNYTTLHRNMDILPLINTIENAELDGADDNTKKAFYINAYNLHVINLILLDYPIKSVQDVSGFFEKKKIKVAGQSQSLNNFEKDFLLNTFNDPRLHFALVCGALGCPPITAFAYTPQKLEQQLELQTKLALNDPWFIRPSDNKTEISQIFRWYQDDFGGNRDRVIKYINRYREQPISDNKISYYAYDWTLNNIPSISKTDFLLDEGNNTTRYVVSSTIPKGTFEVKIFNNLYTQKTRSDLVLDARSTFFTTTVTALYGLSDRLNIGINGRARRVHNTGLPSSAIDVFNTAKNENSRSGLTGIGPMVRWAAIPQWENFSIQSSFTFAIGKELSGSDTQPYIDWNGPVWNTQFFNDFPIGDNFSLFTEIDILLEDIGAKSKNHVNRFSTPATMILSYNPSSYSTLYALTGYSPYWSIDEYDYFYQIGLGAKYQFTPNLEVELLYTDFNNKSLNENRGQAATYNIGLRFNL